MATHPKKTRRQAPAGFTLIELMVVIVIIGLLVALVGPQSAITPKSKRVGIEDHLVITGRRTEWVMDMGSCWM